jgi:hypothetical protein
LDERPVDEFDPRATRLVAEVFAMTINLDELQP